MSTETLWFRSGLATGLLLATAAGRAQDTVYERDGVIVRSVEHDGFPRVSVLVQRGSSQRLVYSRYEKNRFLCSVVPWPLPSKSSPREGLLFTFEYGSGSSRELVIVAPGKGPTWDVVLEANSLGGTFHPPEQVDLGVDGYLELITIDRLVFRSARSNEIDPNRTRTSVWRWNARTNRYDRKGDVPYGRRLAPPRREGGR